MIEFIPNLFNFIVNSLVIGAEKDTTHDSIIVFFVKVFFTVLILV